MLDPPTPPGPRDAPRPEPMRPEPPRPEPTQPHSLRPEPARPDPPRPEPTRPEPTQPQLHAAAATFALLGSAPRLHLAWLMAYETSDVGTLARRVGLSIPTTSQHLAKLRLAGIVSARREGR